MKIRPHRYNIISLRPRHGQKYGKYKMCLSMMMLTCIEQHRSNIWSSVHEKFKEHWGWDEKKSCLYKKAHILNFFHSEVMALYINQI